MTTDTLFPLPEEPADELAMARARYKKAVAAFDEWWNNPTAHSTPYPHKREYQKQGELYREREASRDILASIEAREIQRRRTA